MIADLLPTDEEELRRALLAPPSELTPENVEEFLQDKRHIEMLLLGCARAAQHVQEKGRRL